MGPKVKKQADQTPTGSQKPRKLRVVEATPHTLRLDWIAPKGFYEGYVARLIGDGSSVISTEVELTRKETSYRFKDLQPATPYAFQVAVRGRTLGEFVSVNAATCPMPPRNLKLLSTTATTATIDWDAPDSCTFVDIYLYSVMRLNSGVADESNASVGSTMATHNVYTLQGNGGDYVVEVKAVKHEAVSKAAKMTFSLESIEFTVDIAFVIDAVMSNADTVKTIVNQLLGWPQIAESDARCGIIKFDDTGDKAEVALPLNAYYAKDVEKKLNEMTFYEGDATNTAAGMWTMFEMFRNLRAAEAEAEDDEQAENTENKADATRNADDKALNTTNAADDAAKFAIVITDSVENINECLMEKQESESMNENVKIFVIGIGKFDGGPQLNNLKKLASSPTKQFVFVLDEDYCPMAIIRNAIINKMSEKQVDQTVGPDETGMQHEEFMDSDENALEAVAEPEPEPVTEPEPEAVAEPVAEPEAVAELEVFSEPEMKSVASTAPLSPLQLRGFSESALDKVANVESEAATLYLQESVMNEWAVALGTHSLADLTELRDKDVQKQEDPEQMGRSSVIDLINILRTPLADIEGEISTEVPNDPSPRATTNPILTSTTEQSAPQKRKMKQQDDWSKALGS